MTSERTIVEVSGATITMAIVTADRDQAALVVAAIQEAMAAR